MEDIEDIDIPTSVNRYCIERIGHTSRWSMTYYDYVAVVCMVAWS